MITDDVFSIEPNDLWLGIPDDTKWNEIKQALLFDRPQREFIEVNWSMGVRREFGTGGNLQTALRLPVDVPSIKWGLIAMPKSVSKLILADDILYKVTPTPWLLNEK
jgi:hypothetical protein